MRFDRKESLVMTVKELASMLNIPEASIRFYEMQGLLTSEENMNYNDEYTIEDYAKLKRIIILRKLGFEIEQIISLFDGTLTFSDLLGEHISVLQQKNRELQGALEVCQQIEKDNVEFCSLDVEYYFNLIKEKENGGLSFFEISTDTDDIGQQLFGTFFYRVFRFSFKKARAKYGLKSVFAIALLICLLKGLSARFIWKESFWDAFLYPIELFVMGTAIFLPVYIIYRLNRKLGAIIAQILLWICILFLVGIFLLIAVLLLNAIFRFLF